MEEERTVAELTFHYKDRRLASFIFDTQETADDFVAALTEVVGEKGIKDFRLSGEIKTVYTDDAI